MQCSLLVTVLCHFIVLTIEFRQTSLRHSLEVFETFVRGLESTWQGKLVIENGKLQHFSQSTKHLCEVSWQCALHMCFDTDILLPGFYSVLSVL